MGILANNDIGSGAGSSLPTFVLASAGIATLVAVLVGAMSIRQQLKNYRKPILQRMVVRIMIMVPLYGVSSLIALFSLEAAFVIDVIRDIYEAFVIYCFFSLLLSYLGGERSLLILLHGRPPKKPVFPVSLFQSEIDPSDPYTFLFLKRGILQYVQVKPVLAIATLILKACGKYQDGDFSATSGYLYISIVYNTSICLSLYCLAMFWLCINDDLKSFRPVPKFLCVKGILFFSFWQSFAISILVAAGVITKLGPYVDSEHIVLGLTDTLICLEMPFFAIAHMYAFSYKDFIDPELSFVARMPMFYAFWDAFGAKDVVEDTKATLKGKGMDYREFEPAEQGNIHQGVGRNRRIQAGLRYSKGGKRKYWLPKLTQAGPVKMGVNQVSARGQEEEPHGPLLADDVENVIHKAPDTIEPQEWDIWSELQAEGGFELPFGDLDDEDEELFRYSRQYLFGDYNYPCIDVSTEVARVTMWDEEERVLRDERGAWFSPIRGAKGRLALDQRETPAWEGYGAVGQHPRKTDESKGKGRGGYDHVDGNGRAGHEGEIIIDFEQDRTPAAETSDVRLKWTKSKSQDSRSSSQRQSPRIRDADTKPLADNFGSPPAAGGSSPPTSNTRSTIPRQTSRTNSRTRLPPALPPDAVDLVVEDEMAAEEDRTRERRKGEPVRGSLLRKVYRREFVASEGAVEIDAVEESSNPNDRAAGEVSHVIGDANEDAPERWHDTTPVQADGTAAQPEIPPLQARTFSDNYDTPDGNEENPWA